MQYESVKFALINVELEEIFDWKRWKMSAILNLEKIVKARGFDGNFSLKNEVEHKNFTFQSLKHIING